MSRALLLCLALLATVSAPVANADSDAYAPVLAVAGDVSEATAVVWWLPGTELADSYRVYGIDGGPVLLGEFDVATNPLDALSLVVPSGFSAYAVSGVKANVESDLTIAIAGGTDCIVIEPPDVAVSCVPIIGVPTPVKVTAMFYGLP